MQNHAQVHRRETGCDSNWNLRIRIQRNRGGHLQKSFLEKTEVRFRVTRVFFLTLLAMIAFASNSLLCRAALRNATIDPASFTFIRIFSGAIALWLILNLRRSTSSREGNWISAFALF